MGSSFGLVMVVMCSDVVHIVGKITKSFSYAPRNVKDFLSAVNCAINFRSSYCSIYKCGKAKIHISYKIISSLELSPHIYIVNIFLGNNIAVGTDYSLCEIVMLSLCQHLCHCL